MTSLRPEVRPEDELAVATVELTHDNDADGDRQRASAPASIRQSCSASKPCELDELRSNELLHRKMIRVCKELLLMVFICLIYTVVTHDFSAPKVTKGPAALPFFASDSLVRDWYRGEVSAAVALATVSDIGFVMFYAPWDAESQMVRVEFEWAAKRMHQHVDFSAVNCWQPGSECRRKYSKVFKWPVLLAYTADGKAVQYNGPKTAVHMIAFLDHVMHPFRRLDGRDELAQMMAIHDAVILAKVDCRPKSQSFATAYNTALKLMEKDPMREIGFAIVPLLPDESPHLQLHLWNETLIYPTENKFNTRSITTWLANHMHQVAIWSTPPGIKSQLLSSYMQSPTLILFTPRNPLLEQMDYYLSLKQAALEYFTCNDSLMTPAPATMRSHRDRVRSAFAHTLEHCSELQHASRAHESAPISYTPQALFFTNESLTARCRRYLQCHLKIGGSTHHPPPNESGCDAFDTSLKSLEADKFAAIRLLQRRDEWRCKLAQIARDYHPAYHSEARTRTSIAGLACRSNVSLSMIAMDSLLFHSFAERLGVNVLAKKRKTALLIVNARDETHSVLEGALSDQSLREFVHNFSIGVARRALIDSSNTFRHTHQYRPRQCRSGGLCIRELHARNFERFILNPAKAVIVMYYSLQCAFCSGVSFMFLEAARLLSNVSSIDFVRIDGDRNTLAWKYMTDVFPSILLFPALDKSESRSFPDGMPITVPNLISFILANLDSPVKLQAMWEICNQSKHESDRRTCISSVRKENLAHIERTLHQWRMAATRLRQRILRHLQRLKAFHANLAAETASPKGSSLVQNELDKLTRSSLRGLLVKFVGGHFRSLRAEL